MNTKDYSSIEMDVQVDERLKDSLNLEEKGRLIERRFDRLDVLHFLFQFFF